MRVPWEILAGIAILALSLVPAWTIDLQNAPMETELRFWTTALVGGLLIAVLKKVVLARWVLLVLLGTGVVVSIWSFVVASTIEMTSVVITLAQMISLSMFFRPAANDWFRTPATAEMPDR